jgi:HEPN domain-containing protein
MTPHDRALELLALARQDERAAHVLQQDPEVSDAMVGFHYQQATEKLLKALLADRNTDVPRTHDLLRLLELVREAGYEIAIAEEDVETLTPFAVTLRYEGEDETHPLERTRAEKLVAGLWAWVERQLR